MRGISSPSGNRVLVSTYAIFKSIYNFSFPFFLYVIILYFIYIYLPFLFTKAEANFSKVFFFQRILL